MDWSVAQQGQNPVHRPVAPRPGMPQMLSKDRINQLLESVGYPRAKSMEFLDDEAAHHHLYVLTWDAVEFSDATRPLCGHNPDGTIDLLLRVSGTHWPRSKQLNELAIMH